VAEPGAAATAGPAWRARLPGFLACVGVAALAAGLGTRFGAPAMLFALLLGLALNHLSEGGRWAAGIEFTARTVLRLGVALLGLRITFGQVAELGWFPLAVVGVSVAATIGASMLAARWMGFNTLFGLLTGAATAICGASAALALAAALPAHPLKERATLFTVIGVSALSTLAMLAYPVLTHAAGLDARAAGIFIGATIHDVAQVVGAGYSLSPQSGDVATLVKLMRVGLLVPVIVFAVLYARRSAGGAAGPRPPLLPGFVLAFVLLMALNSSGWLPAGAAQAGGELSRWCLLVAIAGIGMKTQLKELATVGLKPVLLMVGETLFLAALVLALLHAMPH